MRAHACLKQAAVRLGIGGSIKNIATRSQSQAAHGDRGGCRGGGRQAVQAGFGRRGTDRQRDRCCDEASAADEKQPELASTGLSAFAIAATGFTARKFESRELAADLGLIIRRHGIRPEAATLKVCSTQTGQSWRRTVSRREERATVMAEALDKIRAGLIGESEPLRTMRRAGYLRPALKAKVDTYAIR